MVTNDPRPSRRHEGEACTEPGCKGHIYVSDSCGALICTECGTHYDLRNANRLVGCFCGWNKSKLDPYENIDGEDDIPF